MKFKEIKSGMAIHCKNDEEKKLLLEEAERLGYKWHGNAGLPTGRNEYSGMTIHFHKPSIFCDYFNITWSDRTEGVTEFSDLIIPEPELSAEEALLAYDQMCRENYCCNDCPIYGIVGDECTHKMEGHITEIVDAIKKWKADHEKTGPEIETKWFWHGRIYYVSENGNYFPLKGNEGAYDTGCECREMAEKYMADVLKEYCKTHEGNYVAKVEHVCRVKAVE